MAAGGFIVPVPAAPDNAPSARPLTARNPTHSRLERLEFFRDDYLRLILILYLTVGIQLGPGCW